MGKEAKSLRTCSASAQGVARATTRRMCTRLVASVARGSVWSRTLPESALIQYWHRRVPFSWCCACLSLPRGRGEHQHCQRESVQAQRSRWATMPARDMTKQLLQPSLAPGGTVDTQQRERARDSRLEAGRKAKGTLTHFTNAKPLVTVSREWEVATGRRSIHRQEEHAQGDHRAEQLRRRTMANMRRAHRRRGPAPVSPGNKQAGSPATGGEEVGDRPGTLAGWEIFLSP